MQRPCALVLLLSVVGRALSRAWAVECGATWLLACCLAFRSARPRQLHASLSERWRRSRWATLSLSRCLPCPQIRSRSHSNGSVLHCNPMDRRPASTWQRASCGTMSTHGLASDDRICQDTRPTWSTLAAETLACSSSKLWGVITEKHTPSLTVRTI